MKTLFKKIDAFGQPILLSYAGKTEYKTSFGGVLTIIFIILTTIFSLDAIFGLLLRENIKGSSTKIYEVNPFSIKGSAESGLYLSVGFNPNEFNNWTKRHFIIEAEQVVYKRYPNASIEHISYPIDLNPCLKVNFPEWHDFKKYSQGDWLCPKANQVLLMSGGYESDVFEHIKFTVKKCINTSKVLCAPEEETIALLKQYSGEVFLKFSFNNKIINPHSYKMPVSEYMDFSTFFILDPFRYLKSADIFFQYNTLEKDDNILYSSAQTKESYSFDYFREQIQYLSTDSYAHIYFRSSFHRTYYVSSVEKVSSIISRLGGLTSIIYSIIFMIARYITRKKMLISFANFLYNIQKSPSTSSIKSLKTVSIHPQVLNFHKMSFNSNKEDFQKSSNTIIKDENFDVLIRKIKPKIRDYISKFTRLRFNWGTWSLFLQSEENKAKKKILKKALKSVEKDLDVVNILQKVKELDKIKEFLFDNNQRVLFEYFPKPVFSFQDFLIPKKSKLKSKSKTIIKKKLRNDYLWKIMSKTGNSPEEEAELYYELYRAYLNVCTSKNNQNEEKNKRLISMLGKNILSIFSAEGRLSFEKSENNS